MRLAFRVDVLLDQVVVPNVYCTISAAPMLISDTRYLDNYYLPYSA